MVARLIACRKACRVENPYRLPLEADPASFGEIGEGLIHRVAGSADELCEFYLREVVGNFEGLCFLGAKPLSQLQKLFGEVAS